MNNELFECIRILSYHEYDMRGNLVSAKLWGKTLVDGKLKSEYWWKNRREMLSAERQKQPVIHLELGPEKELDDMPVPFEVEFDLPNKNDCVAYFSWLERKKSFDRI